MLVIIVIGTIACVEQPMTTTIQVQRLLPVRVGLLLQIFKLNNMKLNSLRELASLLPVEQKKPVRQITAIIGKDVEGRVSYHVDMFGKLIVRKHA